MDSERIKMILKHLDFDLLTDWEEGFVISVEEQFKRKGNLSELQEEHLEEIWRKNQ